MKTCVQKLLAWILCLSMCMTFLPSSAFAEGDQALPSEETKTAVSEEELIPIVEETGDEAEEFAAPVDTDSVEPATKTEEPELSLPDEPNTDWSGTCGYGLYWDFDGETGTLTITGAGAMYDFIPAPQGSPYYRALPWLGHCANITTVVLTERLTKIGNHAFCACINLTEITIPEAVTSIGYAAFSKCSSLTDITIPGGVTSISGSAFDECSSLTNVTIPEGVTSIGNSAFFGCGSLTGVTIPDSVTAIGEECFSACTMLTAIAVGEGNNCFCSQDGVLFNKEKTSLCVYPAGKAGTYLVPETVTNICAGAFYGAEGLTGLTIHDGVTSIGESAFRNCSGLTAIELPGGVTSIGYSAFSGCIGLTYVEIPEGVTSIGSSTFSGCSSLTGVTLPEGVTSIGYYAFSGCSSLTELTLPEGVTSIDYYAFLDCSSLACVTIPESVTYISPDAFSGCTALADVYYGGSEDEWMNLFGEAPNDATMHYAKDASTTVLSSGECGDEGDNLLWTLYLDGRMVIYGSGEMADYSDYSAPWRDHLGIIKRVQIQEGTASISGRAFSGCDNLTSVTIAVGLTSIGDRAFEWSSNLTDVRIPGTVTSIGTSAFEGCTGLTTAGPLDGDYNIRLGWTESIPDYAFSDFDSLSSVTIPEGVTSVGTGSFSGCDALSSVTIPASVTEIGQDAFSYCPELKTAGPLDGVCNIRFGWTNAIPDDAFWNCRNLTDVEIPDTVTSIGKRAFYGCSSLSAMTFPAGLISIGDAAFSGCRGLTGVALPEGVTSIGSSAFSGCSGLTSVTIPASVTTMGDYSFTGCSGLKTAGPLDGDYNIRFGWTESIPEDAFRSFSYLTGVLIPDGVTSIGASAFYNCEKLESVTIPTSVTGVGQYAFYNCPKLKTAGPLDGDHNIRFGWTDNIPSNAFAYCSSLTGVMIPDGIENIYANAFLRCYNLAEVTIPDSVTYIGNAAFENCSSLTSVTFPGTVGHIGIYVFYGCGSLTDVLCRNASIAQKNKMLESGAWTNVGNDAFFNAAWRYMLAVPCGADGDNVKLVLEFDETGDGTARLTGNGDMEDYAPFSDDIRPYSEYLDIIKTLTVEDGVTSIGDRAFMRCSSVTSVVLPNSVTSIGVHAFNGCTALTQIDMPVRASKLGLGAFYGCSCLESIAIPEGVTELEAVFGECGSLEEVILPHTLVTIGASTFYECAALSVVSVPDNVTWIGMYAFADCSALTQINIPDQVTGIDIEAFHGCSSLQAIVMPDSVTQLGDNAFFDCSSLESVVLSGGLSKIPGMAFYGCSSLTEIVIPDGVNEIDMFAFSGCIALDKVTIPGTLETLNGYAFSTGGTISRVNFRGYREGLEQIIRKGWTTTGNDPLFNAEWTFKSCEPGWNVCGPNLLWRYDSNTRMIEFKGSGPMLTYSYISPAENDLPWKSYALKAVGITMEEGASSISDNAFCGFTAVASVSLPNTLRSIGTNSFCYCYALKNITIPVKVNSIGDYAFDSSGLKEILFKGSAPDIGSGAFSGVITKAYYPAKDDSWTEDVRLNYEGSITWISYDPNPNPFSDIPFGKYYYDPVLWAYYHDPQITGGVDATHFGPNKTCTREQIVTFLWKANGAPEPVTTVNPFTDVKSTKYYYKAVLWAVENGITGGVSADRFGVGQACTREQAMTFIWKACGSPEPTTTENPFNDVKAGKYYYKAVLWAVENGITGGVSADRFGVGQPCTRAQIVTFLYKAMS